MTNVIPMGGYTKLSIDPDKVLEGAKGELKSVIVIGECNDGTSHWYASSFSDVGKVLYLIEKLKHKLLSGDFS